VDPLDLTLDRFVNLSEYWFTRNLTEEKRIEFQTSLSAPIGGRPSEQVRSASGAWSRDAELAQFKQSSR
jgi:hypothetical protein